MSRIQTAAGRAARGFGGLVSELSAARDLPTFLRTMLDLQCKIVAAEYGAIWVRDQQGNPALIAGWPSRMEQGSDNPVVTMLHQAAKNGFDRATSHVLKVEHEGAETTPGVGAHVFVTVLKAAGNIEAVATVVADCRDPGVLQTTAPLRELAAGLYEQFHVKQMAEQNSQDAQRMRKAMALLGSIQEGTGFQGACLNLVNELARQLKCSRVSVGWIKGRHVKVVAMSDTEQLKRHSEHVAHIELAMAECLDQQQPIVCPVPSDAEQLLAMAVVHAHRTLAGHHTNRHALSIPLRKQDEWVGVLTLERPDEGFDAELVQFLQLLCDVIAPELADRRQSDRLLIVHGWESIKWAASYLVGPRHVVWKMTGLLVMVALLYVIFGTWTYKVSADFVLEAGSKRVVPAPYEGDLQHVAVQPGQRVAAGQVLAQLNATEMKLQLVESQARLRLARLEHAKAMSEAKQAEAQQAQAQMEQTQARIQLLEHRIEQSTIRSPIDGVLLSGDWDDKVGGVLRKGEAMFEIAPIDHLVAVLRVSERDINQIQVGQTGRLATRSEPGPKFQFEITRVVPMGMVEDGKNVYEVRAELKDPQPWLRPDMQGLARVDIEPRPIYWIASHQIVNTIRLWLWW